MYKLSSKVWNLLRSAFKAITGGGYALEVEVVQSDELLSYEQGVKGSSVRTLDSLLGGSYRKNPNNESGGKLRVLVTANSLGGNFVELPLEDGVDSEDIGLIFMLNATGNAEPYTIAEFDDGNGLTQGGVNLPCGVLKEIRGENGDIGLFQIAGVTRVLLGGLASTDLDSVTAVTDPVEPQKFILTAYANGEAIVNPSPGADGKSQIIGYALEHNVAPGNYVKVLLNIRFYPYHLQLLQ